MFIGGGVGGIGRIGSGGRRGEPTPPPAGSPDFTLSGTSATTAWATVAFGDLVPTDAPAGAYFVLVGEPAGLAVVNG